MNMPGYRRDRAESRRFERADFARTFDREPGVVTQGRDDAACDALMAERA
jgi:hypothetical protein